MKCYKTGNCYLVLVGKNIYMISHSSITDEWEVSKSLTPKSYYGGLFCKENKVTALEVMNATGVDVKRL